MIALLLLAVAVIMLLGALGSYFFKLSSETISIRPVALLLNWRFWAGGFLYLLSMACYFALLSRYPLSVLYPMSSLTYVWVALLSWKLLDERLGMLKLLGICSIIVGISILTLGSL